MKKNTGKAPSIQFYFKDFLAKMTGHDPEVVGAWMFILCKIWHENDRGETTKTLEQFARIMNTATVDASRLIKYFSLENIANVTERNGKITIINRRAKRDAKLLEKNRLRQKKFRDKQSGNGDVADEKVNPSSSNSNSSSIRFSTNSSQNRNLDLGLQKAALECTERVEMALGPFSVIEQKTFLGIFNHLTNYAVEHGPKVFEDVTGWAVDKADYVSRREGKTKADAIRMFVSEVKKRTGYRGKAKWKR